MMGYHSPTFCLLLCSHFISVLCSSSSPTHLCSPNQSAVLFQFKTHFSINQTASKDCEYSYPKAKTTSWKKGTDCCLRDGVSCDNITGDVISLDLSCSCLSGTFPSNTTLFLLSSLQRLDLSFNDFRKSEISSNFGRFPSLTHLDLSYSWFSDLLGFQAPEPILKLEKSAVNGIVRNLTKVREIDLDGIDMSSIDPKSFVNLSYSLTSLSLLGCHLRGKFPDNIFKLPNIEYLSLDENPKLTGQFPKSNWSSPLVVLSASVTSFSGELPESFGDLKSLTGLVLISSNFSGSIPRSLGNVTQLEFLYLSHNYFSGKIPYSLTNLATLGILSLEWNQLEGSLPDNPNAFPNLGVLDLSNNLLSGTTPSWLYTIPLLNDLNLGNNQFIGHISEFQNRLLSLNMLVLENNSFRGPIPSSISKLVNLIFLDLSSNKLNGTISLDMFSELHNLQYLVLSSNTLSLSSDNSVTISKLVNLTFLDLSSNKLNGTISSDMFSELHNLQHLDLSSNTLSLGSNNSVTNVLRNLEYVDLSSNIFNELPRFLQGSKNLRVLDFSNNRIRGRLSKFPWKDIELLNLRSNFIEGDLPELPPNIRFLSVSNNSLTGTLSGICNAKFIEILDLSQNDFSGVIPQCIGSFSQSLSSFNLKMNKLHGAIPSTFAKGCALKNLNLNSNHLEGPLTPSIINYKEMQVLDVGNNMINDNFPHWIQALSELQVLVLRSNKFHGPVTAPTSPRSLLKLRIVDLSCNYFFGPLPTGYIKNFKGMVNILDDGKGVRYMGERNYSYDYSVAIAVKGFEIELVKILTIFTSIDLSSNNFEGQIPRDIGELSSLRGLNLSHNNLVRHIPSSLRNMTRLEWLDLSSNKLSGQIPTGLLDLTFLSSFNVSYNQLVGPIPKGKQFNTFENGSYQGNEGLCGVPLSRGCNDNVLGQPPPAPWMNSHEDDGSKLEFGWKVVAIGYGFGFIFGAVIGCACLRTGKPKWFVTLFEARRRRR
ncbi:hypothetical protein J1N35_004451 [Gossypium stocksii]|uniref:Leucine-rich repeat-containing N-terminal plant-type domain-containing protein n=1 Tax=Gossypium stocksii TaxID=47602 RepID=A0A9D3WC64_9ROSI|nr:hypothetical protein J1N35_004451 [Gossypium stocksii]